jgi:zinc/manganese transport system substrate-binding protein
MSSTPLRADRISRRLLLLTAPALVLALAACATTPATTPAAGSGSAGSGSAGSGSAGSTVITVVAAENFWGSLAAQLGGAHVKVTSIINSPDADPHDYEPTAGDGREIATAQLTIVTGVGYDAWASKLAAANADSARTDLTVGDLVGAKDGDNPHRWYNPDNVRTVLDAVTAAYKKIDPADAAFFDAQHSTVLNTDLKPYFDTINSIKTAYAGTPVGASESIFAMLAPATGLDLLTPAAFLKAISEGTDPAAADKSTIDAQITGKKIKVYVYNSQNATPDIQAQVKAARAAGIPVTTITETLTPAGASFQQWQVAQLGALQKALAEATGK